MIRNQSLDLNRIPIVGRKRSRKRNTKVQNIKEREVLVVVTVMAVVRRNVKREKTSMKMRVRRRVRRKMRRRRLNQRRKRMVIWMLVKMIT